jgi:hypothetical protein
MAQESLNDLLRSLQAALDEAGARIDSARASRRDAQDRSLTFMLPRAGGGQDAMEAVEIPLDSLRPSARLRVAGVSLDFDCELARVGLFRARRRTVVRIVPGGAAPGRTRRMRIVLECGDRAQGEVRIDGMLLHKPARSAGHGAQALGRCGPSLPGCWRCCCRAAPLEGFVLNEEQSRRVERLCA